MPDYLQEWLQRKLKASMKGRVATVLVLTLSLAIAWLSAADDVDTIRLPSHANEVMAKASAEKRPWKCCNRALCTRSIPPFCWCHDVVERCSGACKDCREAEREDESDPEGYVCHDMYHGSPGPACSSGTDDNKAVAADETAAKKKRPWKCCDRTLCTKSAPPTCSCLDKVERCSGRCKRCGPSESDPSGLFCLDRYHGWPGPKCTNKNDGL